MKLLSSTESDPAGNPAGLGIHLVCPGSGLAGVLLFMSPLLYLLIQIESGRNKSIADDPRTAVGGPATGRPDPHVNSPVFLRPSVHLHLPPQVDFLALCSQHPTCCPTVNMI